MKAHLHWLVVALLAMPLAHAAESAVEPQLPEVGLNIARTQGGWINLVVENNRLVATFFNAERKPVPPDVARIAARIVYPAREDRHVVLNPEGDALVSPPKVRPPHVFRVFLRLLVEGENETPETYSVLYPGS